MEEFRDNWVTRLILRLVLIFFSLSLMSLALTRLLDIPHGDPARGEVLYFGASRPYLACFQCHEYSNIAPRMHDLVRLVRQERLIAPENMGETVPEYFVESIIHPTRYVVPGYPFDLMPVNYGQRLGMQDIQDIVAYLMTL
jgi:hypothetical protein